MTQVAVAFDALWRIAYKNRYVTYLLDGKDLVNV